MTPNPPLDPVHIVAGESAAGCLKDAIRNGLLPGRVVPVSDDLSVGPLGDDGARDAFWRDLLEGYLGEDEAYEPDVAAGWAAARTALNDGSEVVVWGGANPSETILFAALCAEGPVRWHVDVSVARGGPHYVAEYRPEDLAALWPERLRPVSDGERQARAKEFQRLAAGTDVVRRFELGEVVAAPAAIYDPWLIAACGPDWQPAARVVGMTMARCGPSNRVSDGYLASRLAVLIDSGRVEADGPRTELRNYQVRIPPTTG